MEAWIAHECGTMTTLSSCPAHPRQSSWFSRHQEWTLNVALSSNQGRISNDHGEEAFLRPPASVMMTVDGATCRTAGIAAIASSSVVVLAFSSADCSIANDICFKVSSSPCSSRSLTRSEVDMSYCHASPLLHDCSYAGGFLMQPRSPETEADVVPADVQGYNRAASPNSLSSWSP